MFCCPARGTVSSRVATLRSAQRAGGAAPGSGAHPTPSVLKGRWPMIGSRPFRTRSLGAPLPRAAPPSLFEFRRVARGYSRCAFGATRRALHRKEWIGNTPGRTTNGCILPKFTPLHESMLRIDRECHLDIRVHLCSSAVTHSSGCGNAAMGFHVVPRCGTVLH